jgi:hypothetical protein
MFANIFSLVLSRNQEIKDLECYICGINLITDLFEVCDNKFTSIQCLLDAQTLGIQTIVTQDIRTLIGKKILIHQAFFDPHIFKLNIKSFTIL